MVRIGNDWDAILADEWEKEYYLTLRQTLKQEYATRRIYPPMQDIFNALRYTSFADTKVVIIGQDPYHGAGQAHGLCFSVPSGVPLPPSLKNIFQELSADLGVPPSADGDLTRWARQGVLLQSCRTGRDIGVMPRDRKKHCKALTRKSFFFTPLHI